MKLQVIQIARVAHNVIRDYCNAVGHPTYPTWEEANSESRERGIAGVRELLEQRPTPEEQHELWAAKMLADGWTFGEAFDIVEKTHPGLVSYDELPEVDRVKQTLFRSIVESLR